MLSWDVEPQPPDIHGRWFLWKLLVDHRHQGKGYGRERLGQVVELIRSQGATELRSSYVPGEGGPAGFSAGSNSSRPQSVTGTARSSSGATCAGDGGAVTISVPSGR